MASAKELIVRPISASDATRIIRTLHYSGKVVQNSQLHLGVFLGDRCGGAMQFGPSLDKRKIQGLVRDTPWNGFLELNRMAFADWLPRNGESRCIGYAMRFIRKTYPHIQWVVSFADGTQCGDGTIYRASGFVLTGIKESQNLARMPNGEVIHKMTFQSSPTQRHAVLGGRSYADVMGGAMAWSRFCATIGATILTGYQLRYLYFIDPTARARLAVPEVPFSEIDRLGAGMYRGSKRVRGVDGDTPASQAGEGGSIPTRTLHSIDGDPTQ